MKFYYGAAIQGSKERGSRQQTHSMIIGLLKDQGHTVVTEHTTGNSFDEVKAILERDFGPLPPPGPERTVFVRNKMIESVESDIDAVVFDVSVPSLGTGIELAHAYLRPRMGLKEVPILALYEKDYWPNNLSSMIRGMTPEVAPTFRLCEYSDLDDAKKEILDFISLI